MHLRSWHQSKWCISGVQHSRSNCLGLRVALVKKPLSWNHMTKDYELLTKDLGWRILKIADGQVCVLLLQDLLQSCARGGRRRVEDMCYERRRAEACVDESAHHAQPGGISPALIHRACHPDLRRGHSRCRIEHEGGSAGENNRPREVCRWATASRDWPRNDQVRTAEDGNQAWGFS
jgi:hypothetical protein